MRFLNVILGIVLFETIHASVTRYEIKEYDSVAYENATVIRGNARFTVLAVRYDVFLYEKILLNTHSL